MREVLIVVDPPHLFVLAVKIPCQGKADFAETKDGDDHVKEPYASL